MYNGGMTVTHCLQRNVVMETLCGDRMALPGMIQPNNSHIYPFVRLKLGNLAARYLTSTI